MFFSPTPPLWSTSQGGRCHSHHRAAVKPSYYEAATVKVTSPPAPNPFSRDWELDYKESWAPKNWCLWTVVLEKTLESPLDCKKTQPVHAKGDQSWVFIGRTDAEAESPILWPPDAKSWLIWKDPDAGERLRAGGEGDNRGWDGWMASLTQWTWVWVDSGSWWWTGRPDVLQSMGSQGVGHNRETELNWTPLGLGMVIASCLLSSGDHTISLFFYTMSICLN